MSENWLQLVDDLTQISNFIYNFSRLMKDSVYLKISVKRFEINGTFYGTVGHR